MCRSKSIVIVLILTCIGHLSYAENWVSSDLNRGNALIMGKVDSVKDQSEDTLWDAVMTYSYAFREAKAMNDKELMAQHAHELGVFYFENGILDSATHYFLIATELPQAASNYWSIAVSNNNLGAVYLSLKRYEEAEKHFVYALSSLKELLKQQSASFDVALALPLYNNLGVIAKEMGKKEEALAYFKAGIESPRKLLVDTIALAQIYNNLGHLLCELNRFDDAYTALQASLSLRESLDSSNELASSYRNLGHYFQYINQLDSAQFYFRRALTLGLQDDNYRHVSFNAENLRKLFEELDQPDSVVKYWRLEENYESLIREREAAAALDRHALLQEYLTREQAYEARMQTSRRLYSALLVGLGLIAFALIVFLVRWKRRHGESEERYQRTYEARENLKARQVLLEEEKRQLKEEVNVYHQRLASKSIKNIMDQRQELSIMEQLMQRAGNKGFQMEQMQEQFQEIGKTRMNRFWKEFELYFTSLSPEFAEKLHDLNPNLSPNDRRLSAFIRIGLSTKEIADITGKNPESITKARNRLRKKLGLTNEQVRLSAFLQSL